MLTAFRKLEPRDESAFRLAHSKTPQERRMDFAQYWEPSLEFDDYLRILSDRERGVDFKDGHVPSTQLYAFVDKLIAGRLSIRHRLNEFLTNVGGHIGFIVVPEFRRRSVAYEMLIRSLDHCRSRNLKRVLLTCDEGNFASQKTIEKAGGVFENHFKSETLEFPKRRYWIEL